MGVNHRTPAHISSIGCRLRDQSQSVWQEFRGSARAEALDQNMHEVECEGGALPLRQNARFTNDGMILCHIASIKFFEGIDQ
jgi:hypothetical protein